MCSLVCLFGINDDVAVYVLKCYMVRQFDKPATQNMINSFVFILFNWLNCDNKYKYI